MTADRIKELARIALRGRPVGAGDGDTFVPQPSQQSIEQAIKTALVEAFSELPTTTQMLAVAKSQGDQGSRMEYWIAMCAEKAKQWK